MRWERLFDDLEARTTDLELDERDLLADELRDGAWARTSWLELLGGHVVLEVAGVGRVEGDALLATERLVHLTAPRGDVLVSPAAVTAVLSAHRRAEPPGTVARRLGWGHALRGLAGEPVRVHGTDGSVTDGRVGVVGQDFLRVDQDGGRERVVPFGSIAMVSGRS